MNVYIKKCSFAQIPRIIKSVLFECLFIIIADLPGLTDSLPKESIGEQRVESIDYENQRSTETVQTKCDDKINCPQTKEFVHDESKNDEENKFCAELNSK